MGTEDKRSLATLKILAIVFICLFCLYAFPKVFSLAMLAIRPIVIGFFIAFIVNILAELYSRCFKRLFKKKLWVVSGILAVLSILVVLALLIILVIPQFVNCIRVFIARIPTAIEKLLSDPNLQSILGKDATNQSAAIDWDNMVSQAVTFITGGLGNATRGISSTLSAITAAFLGIVFSLYFLTGKDKLLRGIDRFGKHYIKAEKYEKIKHFLSLLNDCSRKYVVGQCTEAVILGGLCALGMLICRMPYTSMISALVGVTSLIPVVGGFIGAIIGGFMIFTVDPIKALVFLIFFVVLQQLEGNLIYPRVVGSSVGLPGVLILAAVTVGGTLFGIPGMLILVPVCAVVYMLINKSMDEPNRAS